MRGNEPVVGPAPGGGVVDLGDGGDGLRRGGEVAGDKEDGTGWVEGLEG